MSHTRTENLRKMFDLFGKSVRSYSNIFQAAIVLLADLTE